MTKIKQHVADIQEFARQLEALTTGSASRLAYSLRQECDELTYLLDGIKTVHFVRYECLGGRTPARPHRMTYIKETALLELHEAQKQADWINSRDGSALSNARVITQYILNENGDTNDYL